MPERKKKVVVEECNAREEGKFSTRADKNHWYQANVVWVVSCCISDGTDHRKSADSMLSNLGKHFTKQVDL